MDADMTTSERRDWYAEKMKTDPIYAIADAIEMGRLHEAEPDTRHRALGMAVCILTGLGPRGWGLQKLQAET